MAELNDFRLEGEGVTVNYSLTSITGDPLFHYKDGDYDLEARGKEIRRQQSELGTLVSVTLEQSPDFRTVIATLLLPTIHRDGDVTHFETYVVVTTTQDNIAGPDAIHGPLQSYRAVKLQGEARHVVS